MSPQEWDDWRREGATREALQTVRDVILDRLVRVVDMPRELWVPTLDAIKGMHDVLDTLTVTGKEEV